MEVDHANELTNDVKRNKWRWGRVRK